jgi:hypothetical protein
MEIASVDDVLGPESFNSVTRGKAISSKVM